MKLTRKHLNQILLQLPHPSLVLEGKIYPTYRVPIYRALQLIHPDTNYKKDVAERISELTFEYSHEEMDWVLKDLDI